MTIIIFLLNSKMESSRSGIDSSAEENLYLDMIIETSFKKNKAQQKERSGKGSYKLNLSADLMSNSMFSIFNFYRLH